MGAAGSIENLVSPDDEEDIVPSEPPTDLQDRTAFGGGAEGGTRRGISLTRPTSIKRRSWNSWSQKQKSKPSSPASQRKSANFQSYLLPANEEVEECVDGSRTQTNNSDPVPGGGGGVQIREHKMPTVRSFSNRIR